MYCSTCGHELIENAKFCPACGAPVDEIVLQQTSVEQTAGQTPAMTQPEASQSLDPSPAPAKPHGTRKAIIVAIVAAILACAGIAGGLHYQNVQKEKAAEQAAWEAAHAKHAVVMRLDAEGYDSSEGTPIPVHVAGTDLDNETVDEVQFVESDGSGLELMQGEYTFDFPASPFGPNGTIYNVSSESTTVTLDSEGKTDSEPSITLIAVSPIDVTDEQISKVAEYAKQSDVDSSKVDELSKQATQSREDAIAEKKAEEEAAAAAEAAKQEAIASRQSTVESFLWTYFDEWSFSDGELVMNNDARKSARDTYVLPGSNAYAACDFSGSLENAGCMAFNAAGNVQDVSVSPSDEDGYVFYTVSHVYFTQQAFTESEWEQFRQNPPQEVVRIITVNDDGMITDIVE